jgi:hypothetical protein
MDRYLSLPGGEERGDELEPVGLLVLHVLALQFLHAALQGLHLVHVPAGTDTPS